MGPSFQGGLYWCYRGPTPGHHRIYFGYTHAFLCLLACSSVDSLGAPGIPPHPCPFLKAGEEQCVKILLTSTTSSPEGSSLPRLLSNPCEKRSIVVALNLKALRTQI